MYAYKKPNVIGLVYVYLEGPEPPKFICPFSTSALCSTRVRNYKPSPYPTNPTTPK